MISPNKKTENDDSSYKYTPNSVFFYGTIAVMTSLTAALTDALYTIRRSL